VKHAGRDALDRLEPLLAEIRTMGLIEKSRGVFYRRSQAFLHFHEDPAGLFADIRSAAGSEFDRFRVEDLHERQAFLTAARRRAAP
jgi:hypothetical protein